MASARIWSALSTSRDVYQSVESSRKSAGGPSPAIVQNVRILRIQSTLRRVVRAARSLESSCYRVVNVARPFGRGDTSHARAQPPHPSARPGAQRRSAAPRSSRCSSSCRRAASRRTAAPPRSCRSCPGPRSRSNERSCRAGWSTTTCATSAAIRAPTRASSRRTSFRSGACPLLARTLEGLPYPLLRVVNGGCKRARARPHRGRRADRARARA